MTVIADHVTAAAWPEALVAALAAWRTQRTPELGDLVDAIGARCTVIPSRIGWLDRALTYDPVDAGTLLAHVADTASEWSVADPALRPRHAEHLRVPWGISADTRLQRILYACRWPADPRVALAIVAWLETQHLSWPRGYYGSLGDQAPLQTLFATIAATLREAVDPRLAPRLRQLSTQPPGWSTASRAAQTEIAGAALAALARLPRDATDERVRALVEQLGLPPCAPAPPRPRRYDPDALWHEIELAPDDDGPRHVLADALLERDDPRGLPFAMQLGRVRGQVSGIIRKNWHAWMGTELCRILMRRKSRFARGMLETIRVGPGSTPDWLYDHAHGHRELVAVRRVGKGLVPPAAYARFVAALPNVHTVAVDSSDMTSALARCRGAERITTLELATRGETAAEILAPLAGRLPLANLELAWVHTVEQLAPVMAAFPSLVAITLPRPTDAAVARTLAAVPQVRFATS